MLAGRAEGPGAGGRGRGGSVGGAAKAAVVEVVAAAPPPPAPGARGDAGSRRGPPPPLPLLNSGEPPLGAERSGAWGRWRCSASWRPPPWQVSGAAGGACGEGAVRDGVRRGPSSPRGRGGSKAPAGVHFIYICMYVYICIYYICTYIHRGWVAGNTDVLTVQPPALRSRGSPPTATRAGGCAHGMRAAEAKQPMPEVPGEETLRSGSRGGLGVSTEERRAGGVPWYFSTALLQHCRLFVPSGDNFEGARSTAFINGCWGFYLFIFACSIEC